MIYWYNYLLFNNIFFNHISIYIQHDIIDEPSQLLIINIELFCNVKNEMRAASINYVTISHLNNMPPR